MERKTNERKSFGEKFTNLPAPLKAQVLKFFGLSVAALLGTISLVVILQDLRCCTGLLLVCYLFYSGAVIMNDYFNGTIICKKMKCIGTTRFIDETTYVIMRECGTEEDSEEGIHKFVLSTSKKMARLFKTGFIMNVYFRPNAAMVMVAWELIGSSGFSN